MSRLERIPLEEWQARALAAQGSVEKLAKSCGVSRRQLQRFIRERWGVVPVRWLNEARLKHAPRLLEKGLTVKEAATALGYENASHFANAFKAFYGTVPSKFGEAEQ